MKFKEIQIVNNLQSTIINAANSKNTKLSMNFANHNQKQLIKINDEYQEKLRDLQIEAAITGSKGEVLYQEDKQSFLFDKEGLKKLRVFSEEYNEKEFEFDFFTTKFSSLSTEEKEIIFKDDQFSMNMTKELYDRLSLFINDLPELKEV